MKKLLIRYFLTTGILLVASVVIYTTWKSMKKPDAAVADPYAGSAGCIECHQKFYDLWSTSHHGLAMQNITPDFIKSYYTELDSTEIRVDSSWFCVTIIRDTIWFRERNDSGIKLYPAHYALGGKNVFYFLSPFTNGRYQVLPLAYDLNKKTWYNNPESAVRHFMGGTVDDVLPWKHIAYTFNTSCYSCHISQLSNNFDLATNTYKTTWKENGINCETCHGPSAEHVKVCREAREGHVPEDLKIIVTGTFSHDQHNSSCGTCHAKMHPVTSSFMPGERFFDHYDLVTLESPDYYPDGRDLGENYTFTSWMLSGCVQSGELDCIHCHTSSGRYRFKNENFNNACLPCHQNKVENVEQHSFHPEGSEGAKCISCHMPVTEFARMRRSDHSMRPPSPLATKEFGSPNACNICHSDQTPDWAQKKLVEWNKDKHQAEMLSQGRLIRQAREGNWKNLDIMLNTLDGTELNEIYSASLIRMLNNVKNDRKYASLVKALKNPSPLVRSSAASALNSFPDKATAGLLLNTCKDEYRLVRISSAATLSSFPDVLLDGTDRKSYDAALAEYTASITSRPDDWAGQANLGNLFMNQGKYDNAIEHFRVSVMLYPENIGALVNAGMAYFLKGNLVMAEVKFKEALNLDSLNELVNLNYALLMSESGRIDRSQLYFEKVLKINPGSATAAYNLSVIVSNSNLDLAVDYARRAVKNEPSEPKYVYTLGFFLNRNLKTAEAISVLEKMIRDFPGYGDSYLLLHSIYNDNRQVQKARSVLQKGISNPSMPEEYRVRMQQLLELTE